MKSLVFVYNKYVIQENNILFRKPPLLGPPLSLPERCRDVGVDRHATYMPNI